MEKKQGYRLWKILTVILLCVLAAAILISALWAWRRQQSDRLQELLESLTYDPINHSNEIRMLQEFKETEFLSDREKAEYYSALVKLYSLVSGNASLAMQTFTNAWIYAQNSHSPDILSWIYADFAQIFVNIESWSSVMHCIDKSLAHAEDAEGMGDDYYAYCYVMLASAYANVVNSNVKVVRQYYEKADVYRGTQLENVYYSLDARLDMARALLAFQEMDYEECGKRLSSVKQYIDSRDRSKETFPSSSWAATFLLPYNQAATLLALRTKDIDTALQMVKESYEVAEQYNNLNAVMNYCSEVLPPIYATEGFLDLAGKEELDAYISDAMIRYTGMSSQMSASTGSNMLYAAEAAALRVSEERKVMVLYRVILNILFAAMCILLALSGFIVLIRKHADTDGLTGCMNRRRFDRVYLRLCQNQKKFGIILYDIDFFKQFNDNYGHAFGDEVLKVVAKTVRSCFKNKKAVLYRYGGDEFAVIWRRCTPEQIASLAEGMVDSVSQVAWENGAKVTLSAGAAHSSESKEDVFQAADKYVYEAKEAGRNCARYRKDQETSKKAPALL